LDDISGCDIYSTISRKAHFGLVCACTAPVELRIRTAATVLYIARGVTEEGKWRVTLDNGKIGYSKVQFEICFL